MSTYLIFQPKSGGHRREHVLHLFEYAKHERSIENVIFLVTNSICKYISESGSIPQNWISFIPLNKSEIQKINSSPTLMNRSLREWGILHKYAINHNVDHCISLRINQLQFALGLPWNQNLPFTISGIFPHPYIRARVAETGAATRLLFNLRQIRRRWSLIWALRNDNLTEIFLLNDSSSAEQLNTRIDAERERFYALPDPIHPIDEIDYFSLKNRYDIDDSRHVFLFAGSISKRKGILKVIDALSNLKKSERKMLAILIAGSVSEEIEKKVTDGLSMLRKYNDIQIRTDFRFLDDNEFQTILRESDLILAPYQRTRGSSGILGHAAQVGTPVLGPKRGLVGEIIEAYGLGKTIDAKRSQCITEGMREYLNSSIKISDTDAEKYVLERTPTRFAETLFGDRCRST